MAKLGQNRTPEATAPRDGTGADSTPGERYCAVCGQDATTGARRIERFGQLFCSEGHAEEFAGAVRVARIQAAAAAPTPRNWRSYLGKAICWGVPLLVVVFLLGGGGALLGAASAVLPVLAFLACPLGMYLMMRSMSKVGHGDDRGDGGAKK